MLFSFNLIGEHLYAPQIELRRGAVDFFKGLYVVKGQTCHGGDEPIGIRWF